MQSVCVRARAPIARRKTYRSFICIVDRQEYTVNWSNRHDKRTVIMHALGSADEVSGYVFGMHLDFDPSLDAAKIEADALAINDHAVSYPFRKYARLWLKADYTDNIRLARRAKRRVVKASDVSKDVADTYDTLAERLDVEVPLSQSFDTKLPSKGMQMPLRIHTLWTFFLFETFVRWCRESSFLS